MPLPPAICRLRPPKRQNSEGRPIVFCVLINPYFHLFRRGTSSYFPRVMHAAPILPLYIVLAVALGFVRLALKMEVVLIMTEESWPYDWAIEDIYNSNKNQTKSLQAPFLQ